MILPRSRYEGPVSCTLPAPEVKIAGPLLRMRTDAPEGDVPALVPREFREFMNRGNGLGPQIGNPKNIVGI